MKHFIYKLLYLGLAVCAGYSVFIHDVWLFIMVLMCAFLFSFPWVFYRITHIRVPDILEYTYLTYAIFGSLLGEGFGLYYNFYHLDTIMHTLAGFILAFIGFMFLAYITNLRSMRHHAIEICVIAFAFSMGAGCVWEIFEYLADQNFGTNMQEDGLPDTMMDCIVNAIGALAMVLMGYGYVRWGNEGLFKDWISEFERRNKKNIWQNIVAKFQKK